MTGYDSATIEPKWQAYWDEHGTFRQPNPGEKGFVDQPKLFVLDMFPYPSGTGLHVGHPEGYTATDIVCRYSRMKGFNVLHPMGYDAFGLPAEQYAVEHGVHPRETAARNIANIERQIRMFGFSYDWSRRLSTTDVDYYRWTQWIFLQMFNSWFDPEAGAARPISELIGRLEAGDTLVGITGELVPATPIEEVPGLGGMSNAAVRFHELSPDQQRSVIDHHRLAYMDEVPVNWCPKLGTVLANEEVTNEGRSDRGDHPVYRKAMTQWMLRITAYSDRLLADLEPLNWPEPIKLMQRNWIGKSLGADVDFAVADSDEVIRVFTTRPDTLFGATYMVLAPEHPLVALLTSNECRKAVEQYVDQAAHKSEMDRTAETKDKTGVFIGAYAINPVNDERIPIWTADYVMMGYGTGAIMAVPAHDTRDFEFATTFELPIVKVVEPPAGEDWQGYVGDGVAVNSGEFDGLETAEFKQAITAWLEDRGCGRGAVNYKLRDWLFSRQRYWGEPFPIIHCDNCGAVGVPEDQLPLELPEMDDFTPATSDDPDAPPQPPLGKATEWVETTCPQCGGPGRRELNTMPQWAGSCWYYLRFLDTKNGEAFVDPTVEQYWMSPGPDSPCGVDLYVGGAEHAVLHLLYARFWHKVLYDLGHASTNEPFGKLFNQGMIRSFAYRDSRGVYVGYEDVDLSGDQPTHVKTGEVLSESVEKMSKSLKNVVNPDEVIAKYGADTFRLYEMFMGPLESSKPWNPRDVPGVHRFCQRVWRMIVGDEDVASILDAGGEADEQLERVLHKTIKKVGDDIEAMKFNTAIAAMMEFVNAAFKAERLTADQARRFVLILAPFTPHLAEELWQQLGDDESLAYEPWPSYDQAMLVKESVEMAVQVNGKMRGRITVAADAGEDDVIAAAQAEPKVAVAIEGKTIVKTIVVPGRMVNIVVKN
ncbi:MAG: leucine--tRNA ligase [Planctomycetota bacterium]|jgi:leucyl-tRNA synthetase